MRWLRRPAAALFLGIVYLGLAACGRFLLVVSTLPGRPGTVGVTLSIRDTPPPGVTVLSAAVTITGAVLQPGGSSLLSAPVRVQLEKLQTEIALLSTAGVPASVFDGLNVTLANPSLTILNNSGSAIGGCASGAVCEIPALLRSASVFIPFALVLSASTPIGLVLDFDLDRSLQNDLSIQPTLAVSELVPFLATDSLEDINDFVGEVTRVGTNQFTVRSDSSGLALAVQVDGATQFLGFGAISLSNNLAAVSVGQIVAVDLRVLPGGTLLARRVELEDSPNAEDVEGVVISTDVVNNRFTLVVLDEVPSISGVAVGNRATVTLQSGASFAIDAGGLTLPFGVSFNGPAALLVGQEVQARVRSLTADSSGISVSTDRVRLRMSQFTAKVGAVSGSSFTVNSLPSLFTAAGIAEIQVQSSSSTEFENVSGVGSLMAGNSVSLRGLLFRTSASPTLVARKVRKR